MPYTGLGTLFPEPHLWGKLNGVAGGAVVMEAMDWFDLLFQGFPFLLLIRKGVPSFLKK